jgi:hypothetical protein
MVVEKGSSTGRLEKPNAPPAAPAKTARLLCIRRLSRSGFPARLRSEKLSPLLMAALAALFAISEMLAGMIDPMALTCRPMIALKRIARLVRSSSRMARASTAWSSNERSDVSLGAFASREEDNGTVGRCLVKVASKGLPHHDARAGNNIRTVSAALGSPTLITFPEMFARPSLSEVRAS